MATAHSRDAPCSLVEKKGKTRSETFKLRPYDALELYERRSEDVRSAVLELYGAYEHLRRSGASPDAIGRVFKERFKTLTLASETITSLLEEMERHR